MLVISNVLVANAWRRAAHHEAVHLPAKQWFVASRRHSQRDWLAVAMAAGCEQGKFCTGAEDRHGVVDCDGDGVVDHACLDPQGRRGVLLGCYPLWGVPAQACPAFFGMGWF
jgi:hypothetical protein